jgi:hypothetical protein
VSDLIVVTNISLSLLAFSLVAWWYVVPALRRLSWQRALEPLLLLHTFRHVGLMFLASGAVKTALPAAFAGPAAWGDLLAAALAFVAIFSLRARKAWAPVAVWVFNVEGSLDLAYALVQGVANSAASSMGAAFWIPAILVPALLVTHALIFWLLVRRGDFEIEVPTSAAA